MAEKEIPQSSPGVSTDRQNPIKYKMPVIPENATPEYFADEIGKFVNAKKRLEKAEKYLKEAMKARWPKNEHGFEAEEVHGDVFDCKRINMVQVRLNTELARETLDAETLKKISKDVPITQLRFKKKAEGWDDLSDDEIDELDR